MTIKAVTALFVVLAVLVLAAGVLGPAGSGHTEAKGRSASHQPITTDTSVAADAGAPSDDAAPEARAETTRRPADGFGTADIASKLASLRTAREREAYINGLARALATMDPLAALEKIRAFSDPDTRDIAMLALLGEWSGRSAAEIIRGGDAGRFGIAGALGLFMMDSGRMTPEQTAAWANEELGGDAQAGVVSRAAAAMAAHDPAGALALGEGLVGAQQARFLASFASGWAAADPQAAREWASKLGDPGVRARVLDRILEADIAADPARAARNLAEMPRDATPARSLAFMRVASGWAGKDTLAAMSWAAGLGDEADRAAAQRGIENVAPVGIGAMLDSGADGLPVVGGVVPGAPASASLNVGDRILAVSGADGGWVDSRGLSMGELVSLIRGRPDTQVSLQVQSPGAAAPRQLTIGRRQIIHSPQ